MDEPVYVIEIRLKQGTTEADARDLADKVQRLTFDHHTHGEAELYRVLPGEQ